MDLDAYVAEHNGEWRALERLTRRWRLSPSQADELIMLYQRTATHLSVIRSQAPDPALLARLSRIVLRARQVMLGRRRFQPAAIGHFFVVTFPVAVYLAWRWWLGVTALSVAAAGGLMSYVAAHPEVQRRLLSDDEIANLVGNDFASYYTENAAQNFAFGVWINNAMVAGIALAAGILILPVLYVLWQNVFNVGLIGGIMIGHGRGDLFFGLIAPHGLLELTAVFVAAGAGLRIGWSWIAPGKGRTRTQALGEAARGGVTVALGLVVVLLVSGVIEAFVTPSPLPTAARIAIGVIALGLFLGYVLVLGRRAALAGETGDLTADLRDAHAPTA